MCWIMWVDQVREGHVLDNVGDGKGQSTVYKVILLVYSVYRYSCRPSYTCRCF